MVKDEVLLGKEFCERVVKNEFSNPPVDLPAVLELEMNLSENRSQNKIKEKPREVGSCAAAAVCRAGCRGDGGASQKSVESRARSVCRTSSATVAAVGRARDPLHSPSPGKPLAASSRAASSRAASLSLKARSHSNWQIQFAVSRSSHSICWVSFSIRVHCFSSWTVSFAELSLYSELYFLIVEAFNSSTVFSIRWKTDRISSLKLQNDESSWMRSETLDCFAFNFWWNSINFSLKIVEAFSELRRTCARGPWESKHLKQRRQSQFAQYKLYCCECVKQVSIDVLYWSEGWKVLKGTKMIKRIQLRRNQNYKHKTVPRVRWSMISSGSTKHLSL